MTPLTLNDVLGAREREMRGRHLVRHLDEVFGLLADKNWEALIPFAELVAGDAPEDLVHTDPALYRTLRKAVTEARVRGLVLNTQKLKELAAQAAQKSPRSSVTRFEAA
jgi:hypothetical protein